MTRKERLKEIISADIVQLESDFEETVKSDSADPITSFIAMGSVMGARAMLEEVDTMEDSQVEELISNLESAHRPHSIETKSERVS